MPTGPSSIGESHYLGVSASADLERSMRGYPHESQRYSYRVVRRIAGGSDFREVVTKVRYRPTPLEFHSTNRYALTAGTCQATIVLFHARSLGSFYAVCSCNEQSVRSSSRCHHFTTTSLLSSNDVLMPGCQTSVNVYEEIELHLTL